MPFPKAQNIFVGYWLKGKSLKSVAITQMKPFSYYLLKLFSFQRYPQGFCVKVQNIFFDFLQRAI